jgi:hypothetical protein
MLLAGNVSSFQKVERTTWKRFWRFCCRNSIQAWVASQLSVAEGLPDRVTTRVDQARSRQWLYTRGRLRELEMLDSTFSCYGIPFLVLKGMALGRLFYEGIENRNFGDVDILVKPEDFSSAERALAELGFQRRGRFPFGLNLLLKVEHGVSYFGENGSVDLHHHLAVHPSFKIDLKRIWSTLATFRLRKQDYRTLSDDYHLVCLTLGAHRDLGLGKLSLRTLLDLRLMLGTLNLEWEHFRERRQSENIWSPVSSIISLTHAVFPLPEAPPVAPTPESVAFNLLYDHHWLRQKLWSWRTLDYPLLLCALHWLATLPLRTTAFGQDRL